MAADALDQEAEEGSALMSNPEPEVCFWCKEHCGGTCLGVTGPAAQMKPTDPLDEALEIMMAMNVPRDRVVITGPELVVTLAFKEPK